MTKTSHERNGLLLGRRKTIAADCARSATIKGGIWRGACIRSRGSDLCIRRTHFAKRTKTVPEESERQNQSSPSQTVQRNLLSQIRYRRAAHSVRSVRTRKCRHPLDGGSASARGLSAKTSRRRRQRVSRHKHVKRGAVIKRAGRRDRNLRRRVGGHARTHGHHLRRHGAVMRAMPPATRRQACVFAAFRQSRQRTQPEEQNQKNGETATHLGK
jgi:hypothetical protein